MVLEDFTASIISLIVTLLVVLILTYLFRKKSLFSREKIIQQVIVFIVLVFGLVLTILALPISTEDKNIILTFVGIIIGAAITFASTTFIVNAMAGVMLRLINPFELGDFIKIDGTFGRVTEINFLHTQVQSVDRDLITVPNKTLVSFPLKTIRSSGTIITTNVSLGYNIPRKNIEKNLLLAAEKTGLENPFVHVMELGDFSIKYKVGGLLKDIESIITAKSDFKKNVIDSLHENGIEIVSPTFMNQRVFSQEYVCLPPEEKEEISEKQETPEVKTEEIIFDKAIEARNLDQIYKSVEQFPERRKTLEEKFKELPDENIREKIKVKLGLLAQLEEELKPAIADLKKGPDITTDMDEKDREIIINTIRDIEAKSTEVDSSLKMLEDQVERLLTGQK
ncbi:mechanosensitive ion channel domain-containing protein [Methanolobus sp. ZRKC2]|uniref:mechanosensitive ion channel family protein n=1 Tax=Methanolobus sp. ZRKC2 TaxID=3125783 RepID=UPI00324A685A